MSSEMRNRQPVDEVAKMKADAIAAGIVNALIGITVMATLMLVCALLFSGVAP